MNAMQGKNVCFQHSSEPRGPMTPPAVGESFDEVVLPHLRSAQRLARWLIRNEHDAEDVVQEASLRALRYFRTFTGGNGRAWFLKIVRNTCCSWRGRSFRASADSFDEKQHSGAQPASDPETLLLRTDDLTLIERAMSNLPDRHRQLLVLRELAGLSYQELAAAANIPMGTVMSSLARARQVFRRALDQELKQSSMPTSTNLREPHRRPDQRHAPGMKGEVSYGVRYPESARTPR
jgi:RNA polymerase sigma-70 factor (ECF subfamily)